MDPKGPDRDAGEYSEIKSGQIVTYIPIPIPHINRPKISVHILKIIVRPVPATMTKLIQIKDNLRPLTAKGFISKLPGIAPRGIKPETKELNRSSSLILGLSIKYLKERLTFMYILLMNYSS
mmetsp:Transcript_1910/g.1710  ORF Transcript_1910/g.1710 Transcript_1910/m.1710 type:complete len:122 (-) Transcript_1910:100-465(-)